MPVRRDIVAAATSAAAGPVPWKAVLWLLCACTTAQAYQVPMSSLLLHSRLAALSLRTGVKSVVRPAAGSRRGAGQIFNYAAMSIAAESEPTVPLPSGVLVVHKPPGWTSFAVCGKLRGTLEGYLKGHGHRFRSRSRLKVGHGGTLDPLAVGMLVIGVGTGCRSLQEYSSGRKGYIGRGKLGVETDTQDSEGSGIKSSEWSHVTTEALQKAAESLTGNIMQAPPIYSALKKNGKRMYELAREGKIEEKDMELRPAVVHRLEVRDFDAASGEFELVVECGGGTYVRTLIVDLARAVGSAAHMVALERTRVGHFATKDDRADAPLVTPVCEEDFSNVQRLYEAMEEAHAVRQAALEREAMANEARE